MKNNKILSEMTLEELWRLFPIKLEKHNICWESYYNEEKKNLEKILKEVEHKKISHIGSTAVKNIWAKPIIDILVEVERNTNFKEIKSNLLENNFLLMSEEKDRNSFNKGYTINGFEDKVYHVHFRYCGDNDELYFRDYLNKHYNIAKEYEILKLDLWKKYEYNRDLYTNMKTEFIEKYTKLAKKEFKLKYKMIRKFENNNKLNALMEIWLKSNTEAHSFIDENYWRDNYDLVKGMLPSADIYKYLIDGKIVGFIGIVEKSYIAGIFVESKYRSKGIGKELLNYCKEIYGSLVLDVYVKNEKAVLFYQNNGFEISKKSLDENTGEYEYNMSWIKQD